MVKFYLNKINKGDLTLEEVPSLWRTKVEKALEELKDETTENNLNEE